MFASFCSAKKKENIVHNFFPPPGSATPSSAWTPRTRDTWPGPSSWCSASCQSSCWCSSTRRYTRCVFVGMRLAGVSIHLLAENIVWDLVCKFMEHGIVGVFGGRGGLGTFRAFQENYSSFFPIRSQQKKAICLLVMPICSYTRIIKGPAKWESAYFGCATMPQFRPWYCARVYGKYTFGKLGRIPNFPHFLRRS